MKPSLHENFFPTGELESREEVIDEAQGRTVRRRWFQNGQLFAETEFVGDTPHGRARQWTEAGTLILDATNKNGLKDGLYQSWWDDGRPKERGLFIAGERQKGYCWYHPDGSLWKQL